MKNCLGWVSEIAGEEEAIFRLDEERERVVAVAENGLFPAWSSGLGSFGSGGAELAATSTRGSSTLFLPRGVVDKRLDLPDRGVETPDRGEETPDRGEETPDRGGNEGGEGFPGFAIIGGAFAVFAPPVTAFDGFGGWFGGWLVGC